MYAFTQYEELNALRTRDGKYTHTKQPAAPGKKDKKGTEVHVTIPMPLPEVPPGVKDSNPTQGGDASDTMSLPAALHLCFPDLFPTMVKCECTSVCVGVTSHL